MSACISRHGEFSEHYLDDSFTCTVCLVLDEDALRAELERLRAELGQTRTRNGPPAPGITYEAMWDQLTGYVLGAVSNPKLNDAAEIQAYMRELSTQRQAPVADWINSVRASAAAPSGSEQGQ